MEAERRGYGINIPFPELTEDKLSAAINEILSNSSYQLRAEEHGKLVMDEMTKPLERAVWWMEYAMRYPGEWDDSKWNPIPHEIRQGFLEIGLLVLYGGKHGIFKF